MNQLIEAGSAPGQQQQPMDYEAWEEKFKPIKNPIDGNAAYDGTMFETYGPELEAVKQANPLYVWTLVEGDEGQLVLSNGYHFVNRIGYFLCEIPFEPRPGQECLDITIAEGDAGDYPLEDWQYEVANGDSRLGYWEWVAHKREADGSEASPESKVQNLLAGKDTGKLTVGYQREDGDIDLLATFNLQDEKRVNCVAYNRAVAAFLEEIVEVDDGSLVVLARDDAPDVICAEKDDRISHLKVEYDTRYTGGEYSGVGTQVLIQVDLVDAFVREGNSMDDAVGLAFTKQTKLDAMHIVYYNLDELYDQVGEPLSLGGVA